MDTKTNHSDGGRLDPKVTEGPRTPRKRRSKQALGITLAALIGFFSLGMTAPAATASTVAEPSTDVVYQLDVNGQTTTLTEGQTAVFPMHLINSAATSGLVTPNVVYPGDGSGTLTVTASAGVYHWSIDMHVPATEFIGSFYVTDLTSGFGGGAALATGFSGSAPTSKLHNHRYSGTLTGTASFLGIPVSTTGPNNTLYTYN
ncbi:MAG TPA: hypothetical protein VGC18_10325 [Lacisediminihabitans sp.]|uniref:hypothetical protein n=1 Tax=Lacisediminihabitans sp. TaxID=2787631 RepID=UPI002ED796E1